MVTTNQIHLLILESRTPIVLEKVPANVNLLRFRVDDGILRVILAALREASQ